MKETQLSRTTRCLACRRRIECASSAFDDAEPKAGDITVCIYCGHIMAFRWSDRNLKLDELNQMEIYRVAGDRRILLIQRAIAEKNKERLQ